MPTDSSWLAPADNTDDDDFERWSEFPSTQERFDERQAQCLDNGTTFKAWLETEQARTEYEKWLEDWELDEMEARLEYRRESDRASFEAQWPV